MNDVDHTDDEFWLTCFIRKCNTSVVNLPSQKTFLNKSESKIIEPEGLKSLIAKSAVTHEPELTAPASHHRIQLSKKT
jgi:hypothetical protein